MRTLAITATATAAIVLAAASAVAEPASPHVQVAAKVGGMVPLDGLGPAPAFGVEVGYRVRAFAFVVAADYARPTTTGRESDPRVAGGMYTWQLTEEMLAVMPAAIYRRRLGPVTAYGGVGVRVLFLRSRVRDDGMPAIAETTEQSTAVALGIPVGAERRLGPGSALAELLFQYGGLDHTATGASHTGGLGLALGYRVAF